MTENIPFIRELQNGRRTAAAAGLFLAQWHRSRQYRRLVYAVPALLLATAFVWSTIASRSQSRKESLLRDYLHLAREAVRQNDTAEARLLYRRAQSLSAGREEITFEFASSIYDLGHQDEALQMMAGLAPARKTGYLPAHRFLVDHVQTHDTRKADLFRAVHLGHVVRGSRDSRRERLQLLTILARYRNFERAEQLLRETLEQYPEDLITLARLKAISGNTVEARNEAKRACVTLRRLVEATPSSADLRIQLAQGHVFLGEFNAALETLADGLDEQPSPKLLDAISATYSHWYSLLSTSQQTEQQACILLLLGYSENSTAKKDLDPDFKELSSLLQVKIRTDRSSGILPFLIGSVSAAAGDLARAETHLRAALELAPEDPSIKNNLAWVLLSRVRSEQITEFEFTRVQSDDSPSLASTHSAMLQEALQYSDHAVGLMPEVTSFRETRAQLRSMLGRHSEAVVDFKDCLNAGLESREIHQTLSKSLFALGHTVEAREHVELAEHLPVPQHAGK